MNLPEQPASNSFLTAILLGLFFAMQVTANLFFACGSRIPSRWAPCFVLGNVVGVASIWPMMQIYQRLQPNIAMALAGGGTFICVQLALASAFHGHLTWMQWAGILLIMSGIFVTSLCGR